MTSSSISYKDAISDEVEFNILGARVTKIVDIILITQIKEQVFIFHLIEAVELDKRLL